MTNLKARSGRLREEYAVLLSQLPDNVYEKVSSEKLQTVDGLCKAITQLVSLHSGEIVELSPQHTQWRLRWKGPGSASPDWESDQWYCCQDGFAVGDRAPTRVRDQYGRRSGP